MRIYNFEGRYNMFMKKEIKEAKERRRIKDILKSIWNFGPVLKERLFWLFLLWLWGIINFISVVRF